MKTLLNYNFRESDILDKNFDALYRIRRRDAGFAYVYEDHDAIYAIRDHLGICPLWYTTTENGFLFSTNLGNLPHSHTISDSGIRAYLGLGTTKIKPLFARTHLVPPGTVMRFAKGENSAIVYQYSITPRTHSFLCSFSSVVGELDELLRTAIIRQTKHITGTTGLYLSGGIDSGLIGLYLKELGIPTTTFSALKRGSDDERKFLNINIEAIKPVQTHTHTPSTPYEELSKDIPSRYRQPHGNTTALAICSLWRHTPIEKMSVLFFGQNSDVINNAMDNRDVLIFSRYFPHFLSRQNNSWFRHMLQLYMEKHSHGVLGEDPLDLSARYNYRTLTNFQLLALAGMFLRRTPVDGEMLAQPTINAGIPIGNPYYDIDVIEFILGIRLVHKVRFGKGGMVPFSLDKRALQALALQKGLPEELVYRKKGFTVSHGHIHQHFFDSLPHSSHGIECKNMNQRFAAHVLDSYMSWHHPLD